MTTYRIHLPSLFVALALALPGSRAAAQHFIAGPILSEVGGQIFIGTPIHLGRAFVAFQPSDGSACQAWAIGFDLDNGGLAEYVNVWGSKRADIISFPDLNGGPNQLCGATWGPLITNAHGIEVTADGGNDTIINVTVPDVFVDGGGGDDTMLNYPSVGQSTGIYGFDGADTFFSDPRDYMVGQAGNDLFCMGGRARYVDGSSGVDRMCGDTADTVKNVENRVCTCF